MKITYRLLIVLVIMCCKLMNLFVFFQGYPARTSTALVDISLTDSNDEQHFHTNIAENASVGMFVMKITSTDADIGENAVHMYAFTLARSSTLMPPRARSPSSGGWTTSSRTSTYCACRPLKRLTTLRQPCLCTSTTSTTTSRRSSRRRTGLRCLSSSRSHHQSVSCQLLMRIPTAVILKFLHFHVV